MAQCTRLVCAPREQLVRPQTFARRLPARTRAVHRLLAAYMTQGHSQQSQTHHASQPRCKSFKLLKALHVSKHISVRGCGFHAAACLHSSWYVLRPLVCKVCIPIRPACQSISEKLQCRQHTRAQPADTFILQAGVLRALCAGCHHYAPQVWNQAELHSPSVLIAQLALLAS